MLSRKKRAPRFDEAFDGGMIVVVRGEIVEVFQERKSEMQEQN